MAINIKPVGEKAAYRTGCGAILISARSEQYSKMCMKVYTACHNTDHINAELCREGAHWSYLPDGRFMEARNDPENLLHIVKEILP